MTREPRPRVRTEMWTALAVFIIALLIRLPGIGWTMPSDDRIVTLHPDEPVVAIYSEQVDPLRGQFTPGFYNYGTLYLSVLRLSADTVSSVLGLGEEANRFAVVAIAGRGISLLAGAGTALVVFLFLRRRTHVLGAWAGSLAIALAPAHVMHSRFQTVDVLATFLAAVSLLHASSLSAPEGEAPPARSLDKVAMLAGLFAGLSAGTKYTGILALLCVFIVAFMSQRERAWRLAGIAAGTAVAAFLLSTPGAFLDGARFLQDFRYEMTHTGTGHGLVFASTSPGFVYHLSNLLLAVGILTLVIGAGGLGRAAWRRHAWAVGLIGFSLVYFLLIARAEVKFLRYVFPLLPPLAIGFGWLVGQAHNYPGGKRRWVVGVAILALGGFMGGGISETLKVTAWMAGEDPRDTAVHEIWRMEVRTVGLVSDPWFYTPSLYPQAAVPRTVPAEQRDAWMRETSGPSVVRYIPPAPEPRKDWDVRLFDLRPGAIVYSSFEWDDIARVASAPQVPEQFRAQAEDFRAFTARLNAEYEPHRILGADGPKVHDMMYVRPQIWIWKRKADSRTPSSGSSTTSGLNGEPVATP